MSPLTLKKRRLYFLLFFVVFLLAIPVLLLYTSGYRIGNDLTLVKTGGVFVSAPVSGAEIYINNKLEKTTNIIQKNFFAQNLKPGTYFIFIYKDGYWPWSKELKVHEQLVSEAHSFLVPREPKLEEITKMIVKEDGSLSKDKNPVYADVLAIFSTKLSTTTIDKLTTESGAATSTVTRNKVTLIRESDAIYAKWLGNLGEAPSAFCDEYKRQCAEKITVFSSPTKIKTFDFYPGRNDVIVIARKNGIYAVETDTRKIQNFALVYAGGDPDFRIGSDGNFYVKDGPTIYKVTL